MRQGNYLNVVLTVIAVLLAALLWTQIASTAVFARTAEAQPPRPGFPVNAANQRDMVIRELREVRTVVDSMRKVVEGGALRVEVMNLDEIRIEEP